MSKRDYPQSYPELVAAVLRARHPLSVRHFSFAQKRLLEKAVSAGVLCSITRVRNGHMSRSYGKVNPNFSLMAALKLPKKGYPEAKMPTQKQREAHWRKQARRMFKVNARPRRLTQEERLAKAIEKSGKHPVSNGLVSKEVSRCLGEKLRHVRLRDGITQREMGEEMKISRREVAQLEAGSVPVPLTRIKQAARLLGFPFDCLVPHELTPWL